MLRRGGRRREEGFADPGRFLYKLPVMSMTKAAAKKEALEILHALVEQSKTARLTAEQEEEAAARMKELLALGRASIAEAVEAMLALQWNVGVAAVTALWPEMKPLARKAFLTALAAHKTDGGKRLRLSLARGLFVMEPEAAAEMAVEVCAEMRAEGPLAGKDRMIFSNVLIGKGKPWLQHFPLAEWKPAQGEALVTCAVETCFGAPCAPFTQISLLRWLADARRLAALPEEMLAGIARVVKRWTPRFRRELQNEVAELPPVLAEAVALPASQRRGERAEPPGESHAPDAGPVPDAESAAGNVSDAGESEERDEETRTPEEDENGEPRAQEQEPRETRQYPPYVPRSQPSAPPPPPISARPARRERGGVPGEGVFDLTLALRQIEAHVTGLRRELRDVQNTARQQREERPSPSRGRRGYRGDAESAPAASSAELEELRRHNAQLEETAAELRRQLEELANDHEDHATAMGAHGGEPAPASEVEQLKVLLGIKLRELFAEFQTLRSEPADDVLRQHYGDMLAEVFEVLAKQGVPLSDVS